MYLGVLSKFASGSRSMRPSGCRQAQLGSSGLVWHLIPVGCVADCAISPSRAISSTDTSTMALAVYSHVTESVYQ